MDIQRMLEAVTEDSLAAWLALQRYKMHFPLGIRMAIVWLRVRYNWDDEKEQFVSRGQP